MSKQEDNFKLERFLVAQESCYDAAIRELKNGQKRSHWMWFIFPQVSGLGSSSTAQFYAIRSREEAEAYLLHPILGQRLGECAEALLKIEGKSARSIMGEPDDLKLKSSMTLFAQLSGDDSSFHKVLKQYYDGQFCQHTIDFLTAKQNG